MTWRTSLALFVGISVAAATALNACQPPPPAGAAAVTVSGPVTHANLSIFLLHGKDTVPAGRTLLTLQEAMAQKKLIVHETSNVNELSIENVSSDAEVFVQSGDIVRGGKQDRLLAVDMIVSPQSGKIPIASFCCESGRWRQRGGESAVQFAESSKQAANKDVKLALNAARDQSRVWDEVRKAQQKLEMNVGKPVAAAASPTSYQLSLEDKELVAKVEAYEKPLKNAVEGKNDVVGFAIVVNGKVQGAEIYGSSALFRKLWPKLLNAAATDALAEYKKDAKFAAAAASDVEKFLAAAERGKASEVKPASVSNRRGAQQAVNAAPQQERTGQQAAVPRQIAQGTGQQEEPASTPQKPPRVRIMQRDSDKILMLEAQDTKSNNAIVHRSYIAK